MDLGIPNVKRVEPPESYKYEDCTVHRRFSTSIFDGQEISHPGLHLVASSMCRVMHFTSVPPGLSFPPLRRR